MKKLFVFVAVMGLLAAACSSSSSADSCDDVAQAGLDLLQDALDELGGMSIEEVAALGEGEQPAAFDDIERAGDQIDEDATALGCDEADLEAYVVDRVDTLTADGAVAELVLAQLQADPGALFAP
ncbi:MAG: hypothetical protein OEM94_05640 [Acidimicrobiia bacterium]|nr:hypothetical protein [Acidimicrobiia bacterium]